MEVLQECFCLWEGKLAGRKVREERGLAWLTIVPRRPTIMRLQITSDLTTKSHDSLNSATKLGRSSAVCCSARMAMTLDAREFACSAADERISDSSSCSAEVSTGVFGDL